MFIMKFNFGNNWQNFIDNKLDDERINIANKNMGIVKELLKKLNTYPPAKGLISM